MIEPGDYVELHAASAFSFLRGGSDPEALVKEAARLELPTLAVLDRDGVFSAPRLYSAGREQKVRPIVGAEITLADGSVLPLLAKNRTGYQNLCQLISTAKLVPRLPGIQPAGLRPDESPDDRKRRCFATWEEIAAHAEGLVALTGDEDGPLRRAWQRGGRTAVEPALAQLRKIFADDRLFVEVQRHRVRGEEAEFTMLTDLASSTGLPLLATGGALHATRADRTVTDLFTCLRNHTSFDAAGRLLAPNGE